MIQSTKKLPFAALIGLSLLSSVLATAPSQSSPSNRMSVNDRIAGAFEISVSTEAALAIWAAPRGAEKGDLAINCDNETWPDIEASCLARMDGSGKSQIRSVTIGYAAGHARTVLLRKPAPQIASR